MRVQRSARRRPRRAAPAAPRVFWDCAGAGGAGVAALEGELTEGWAPQGGALRREHLWPARSPTRALHAGAWGIVCMAAVTGVRAGFNWVNTHQDALGGGRVAVQKMWEALADAAGTGVVPDKWRTQVPAGHPFLRPEHDGRRWMIHRRAVAADPAMEAGEAALG